MAPWLSIVTEGSTRFPRGLDPQLPSNIPQIPASKGHQDSIEGPLEGPGVSWDLGLGVGRWPFEASLAEGLSIKI